MRREDEVGVLLERFKAPPELGVDDDEPCEFVCDQIEEVADTLDEVVAVAPVQSHSLPT